MELIIQEIIEKISSCFEKSFLLCTHLPRFLTKIFFNTLQTWAGKL
jgi:hypothetical protein